MSELWEILEKSFKGHEVKTKIIRYLFMHGLGLTEKGRFRCGDIEIPNNKIARALNVSSVTLSHTVKMILHDPTLAEIFLNLEPTYSMKGYIPKYNVLRIHLKREEDISKLISEIVPKFDNLVRLVVHLKPDNNLEVELILKTRSK